MRNLILSLITSVLVQYACAQVNVQLPNGYGENEVNIFYGSSNSFQGVPYENIKDSPFWFEDWLSAALYDNNNVLIGRKPVSLNLATGELYFYENGKAFVAENEKLSKVVFYNDTSSKYVRAVFLNNLPFLVIQGQKVNSFAQVLTAGHAMLIKYHKKELAISGELGMKKVYYFKDIIHYFVQVDGEAKRLNKLSAKILLKALPGAAALESWVYQNKLDLEREMDAVRFIQYYNLLKSKEEK